ncbi:MAG: hypothetical protein HEEMFOPI_01510 [Holosporales bacterium]
MCDIECNTKENYEYFLGNALLGGENDERHFISVGKIKEALGRGETSKTTDLLKEDLKNLAKIQIEWNVLNVDKKNKWTAMQLLSEVSIEGSQISYAYPPSLREMLFKPNIFAKLNMKVQQIIKKRNSLVLWELLCGEFSLNKSFEIITKWFSYDDILKLNGLGDSVYKNRYNEFIQKIVESAVVELNEKSDISVSYEVKREGRKITFIRFIASKKEQTNSEDIGGVVYDEESELKSRLEGLGFNKRFIATLIKKYTKEEIENVLDIYYQKLKEGDIKYPVGFLKKALEEGWMPKKEKEESVKSSFVPCFSIDENEEEWIKKTRRLLIDQIGDISYGSWFSKVIFLNRGTFVEVISPSIFHSDWIKNNYEEKILIAIERSVGEKTIMFRTDKAINSIAM